MIQAWRYPLTLTLMLAGSLVFASDTPQPAVAPFDADQAKAHQQRWAEHIDKPSVHTNSIGMKMVLLPPGEFTMGRTEEQFDRVLKEAEKTGLKPARAASWEMLMMPAHRVRITKPFYMGATEVTVAQYRRFCDESGYKTEAERGLNHGKPYKGRRPICTWRKPMVWIKLKQHDDEPVLHLCWNDCVAFCEWLSRKEGVEYCLPTEAEWEYACRAGTTTAWSFGNFEDFDRLGHKYMFVSEPPQGKHKRPSRVAQKQPNPFGLYDIHGNVWEYVADWWHRYTYKNSPLNDPTGPTDPSEKGDFRRIIRAGSFDWGRWGAQSLYRMRITQRSTQHPHQSFRVAMRIKDVKGVAPAVDPKAEQRAQRRDPGVQAKQVVSAIKASIGNDVPNELTIDVGSGVKMQFVLIPAGTFLMGSDHGGVDEQPVHRVVISKPFYMAKHELTTSQWEAVMGKHAFLTSLTKGDNLMKGPTKAMNVLSWNDCRDLIAKLRSRLPQHAFSLPTEAQWEYACRAGGTTEFYYGDDAAKLGDYAWFEGNMIWPNKPAFEGKAFYHDVGRKKPNAFGLFDMHGGVWEWCADHYAKDYYLDSPLIDPAGPKSGRFRVVRGGSWFRYAKYCRSAYRRFCYPECDGDAVTAWINDFGCRLVINLDDNEAVTTKPKDLSPKPKGPSPASTTLQLAENLKKHSANPVLGIGKSDDWDGKNCGCFSVDRFNGKYHLYYMGSGPNNPWRIGLATSDNGIDWQRHNANPVLPQGPAGSWDDRAVSMPYIVNDGKSLCMIYSGSGKGGGFGLAMSQDGVKWDRYGNKPLLRGVGGSMDPCLRKYDGKYTLWYCGKQGKSYRIFRATSSDGIRWTKHPKPVLPLGNKGDYDEVSHAGPVVVRVKGMYYMFHLGGSQQGWKGGLATSSDGIHWTKSKANPILEAGGKDDWDGGSILSIDAIWQKDRFHVWYAAHSLADAGKPEHEQAIKIGYAVSE